MPHLNKIVYIDSKKVPLPELDGNEVVLPLGHNGNSFYPEIWNINDPKWQEAHTFTDWQKEVKIPRVGVPQVNVARVLDHNEGLQSSSVFDATGKLPDQSNT